MVSRRQVLGTIGGAALVGTAGCVDFVTGEGLFYESAQATVSEEALNETGYAEDEIDSFGIDESVGAFGISRTVEITNWQAEYERTVDIDGIDSFFEAGSIDGIDEAPYSFVAVSTPQVSVFGQELNPVGNMDAAELIDRVEGQYDGVGSIEEREEVDATVLDENTTLTRFEAEASVAGIEEFPIIIEITEAVESEDDLVLTVATYPDLEEFGENLVEDNPGAEESATLRGGVEHPQ